MPLPLSGKVALVAGATRGAGRGIAIELGAAGADCQRTPQRGDSEFWEAIEQYRTALSPTGEFAAKRQHQSLSWMWQLIDAGLRQHFRHHPGVRANLPDLAQSVQQGRTTPAAAAHALLDFLKH